MPQFFINRPVFAWVVALFIIMSGLIALPQLPIERYPSVAPPQVTITAVYPGATPQTMNDSVLGLIERELSSLKNLLYFESSSDTSGAATITASFKPGVNPELAQVDVQNRLKTIEARLPQTVRQNGLIVEAASSGFLMLVSLKSDDNRFDSTALSDYMARNVIEELRRIEGVGRVQLFGAEQAMRIWVDPVKLTAYNLSMADLSNAITQQNIQIAPGRLGDEPAPAGQKVAIPLMAKGQLETPEEFANIVLRAEGSGAKLVLGDVARVELGAQSYAFLTREDGKTATAAAIQLAPGANAVLTSERVKERMQLLQQTMPVGMSYSVPFDTAPFAKISIEKVAHTLIEAMVLVFLVMYLFLQNVRYTLIPAIVAPIALLGTFAVMMLTGFSINVLTMFGMVLAIGIIVDDAIVVVENVERLMAKEGLSPRDATVKAMKEITGAIIGITLVLTAVFIPMALASGSVGVIYQQFTLSMAISILFSAFLALTFTPALCATLLKPISHGHAEKTGFFGWFNRRFDRMTDRYGVRVSKLTKRIGRVMLMFALLVGMLVYSFGKLPSAFLPEEDQGYFITSFLLPSDATTERTSAVVKSFEEYVATRPGIKSNISILGYGLSGSGTNAAVSFTMLKDWDERNGANAWEEVYYAYMTMAETAGEGLVFSIMPPAIDELGNSSGFSMRLIDRSNQGYEALQAAQAKLLELANNSKIVTGVYADSLPAGTGITLHIDRQKAEALGVSFAAISDMLSTAMGSSYINDFPNRGRMQQVIIQADSKSRMQIEDILKLRVRNVSGGMVALSEVVTPKWGATPLQLMRFQGLPSVRIAGGAAPTFSSGEAMDEMERLAAQLPPGFDIAWTGQSLQERQSASQAPMLMALSMLVVFLVLAALYESWAIPVSVMLVVPLGLLGAVGSVLLLGMSNDVFFKVGMITVIGLSAKNAVLIVEFAKQLREEGHGLIDAAVTASRLRLRPILMTSLAFGLGILPLVFASGASAETQAAIGVGVFGGMVTATVLAIYFVPVFFVLVMSIQERFSASRKKATSKPQASNEESV